MTTPASSVEGIDLSLIEFWAQSLTPATPTSPSCAHSASRRIQVPENPFSDAGDGYYAFVSHADVSAASRQPELFSSARGATSIRTCRRSSTSTSAP